MAVDEETQSLARATELIQRGPGPAPGRTAVQRLRGRLRAVLLRVLRPYSHHQGEVNTALLSAIQRQTNAIERQAAEARARDDRHDEQIERLEDLVRELIYTAESLRRVAVEGDTVAHDALARLDAITAQLRAEPYVAGRPFERFSASVGEVVGLRERWGRDGAAGEYPEFEDVFRGPRERVADLQRPYLGLVHDHQPVLDVGCGRGEFLELLAAEGIDARGVDSDAAMVARCAELGLPAVLADATVHLEGLPDGELGTVYSSQVIEHLPFAQLRGLLELALRKLRPGGLFIAETVNPHNVAALKTFWVDPTHQHPLFPEVALTLCAFAGFAPAYVFAPGHEDFDRARFDSDRYAVVGTRPASDG